MFGPFLHMLSIQEASTPWYPCHSAPRRRTITYSILIKDAIDTLGMQHLTGELRLSDILTDVAMIAALLICRVL